MLQSLNFEIPAGTMLVSASNSHEYGISLLTYKGDCVVLMTKGEKQGLELIVKHTSLFFTVFKKVDTDSLVQVPRK